MSKQLIVGKYLPFIIPILFLIASFDITQANFNTPISPDRIIELSSNGKARGNALAFSPDGSQLAVGSSSGVSIYNTQHLDKLISLDTGTWVRTLAFSSDGKLLAVGLYDQSIRMFHLPSTQPEFTLIGHDGWVRQLVFTPDGTILYSVSDDGSLKSWNTRDGSLIETKTEGLFGPRTIAVSPNGDILAVGMHDGSTSLLKLPDLTFIRKMAGHKDWVRCLAFSPDGKTIATGSFDKLILLWDMETGGQIKALEGHNSSVLALAFSPDGSQLVSGSVDQTVRIWHLPDGNPLSTLIGHTDFVYAVAFSPDGKTIASTGNDNTVRLWDTAQVIQQVDKDHVFPAEAQVPVISADCRDCHHPRGQVAAPRVIDMSCESCHINGAGLNWCTLFPRSPLAKTEIDYNEKNLKVGFPIAKDNLFLEIAVPSNGETLFANEEYIIPVAVTGRVFSGGSTVSGLTVKLEAWKNDHLYTSLFTQTGANGTFDFNVMINPDGELPVTNTPGVRDCHLCHDDPDKQGFLPDGEIRIVVTVIAGDGSLARDECWLIVDIAKRANLAVQVSDPENGETIPNLSVQAHSVFYEWKDIYSTAKTDRDGHAVVDIRQLSQARSLFSLSVPPAVIDGVRYSGGDPVEVLRQPFETSTVPVILSVYLQKGLIVGNLEGLPSLVSAFPLSIWAVRLPAGPAYQTELNNDLRFEFEPLPISRYRVFPDLQGLADIGRTTTVIEEDLFQEPETDLVFELVDKTMVQGTVSQADSSWLPFAWLTVDDHSSAEPVNPQSGNYTLKGVPDSPFVITASAPGFYSRSQRVNAPNLPVRMSLNRRPDTRVLKWGAGSIILPAETDVDTDNKEIIINRGWIWGDSIGAKQPITVKTPAGIIEIENGRFALEVPRLGITWLYLVQGHAFVTQAPAQSTVEIMEGQMIALVEGSQPMEMHNAILAAFHPTLEDLPVSMKFEPNIWARLANGFNRAGINLAQMLAFAAYIATLLALIIITVVSLFLLTKRLVGKRKFQPKEFDE